MGESITTEDYKCDAGQGLVWAENWIQGSRHRRKHYDTAGQILVELLEDFHNQP